MVTLLVAILVLAAGELGARALAPYLPEPLLWHDEATQVKAAQMDERAEADGCVPVVFVGNSMTRDALVPDAFTAADPAGRRAYNAALDAATPALLERWVTEEVVPRLRPHTVVIGLSSFDLNDNADIAAAAVAAYDRAPLSRSDLWGRLQAPFLRWSDLIRYRTELRDPDVLGDAVARAWRRDTVPRPGPAGIPGILGADGQGLSRRDLRYTGSPTAQQFVREQLLNEYSTDGTQRQALERLVRDLQAGGVQVVLVVLPVTDDYVATHPHGETDMADFVEAVDRVAAGTGAHLVDARSLVTDTGSFADTHHLNARGAEALSASLPDLLPPAPDHGCP